MKETGGSGKPKEEKEMGGGGGFVYSKVFIAHQHRGVRTQKRREKEKKIEENRGLEFQRTASLPEEGILQHAPKGLTRR